MFVQESLLGSGEPIPDAAFASAHRRELSGGAWLDVAPTWLQGDATLYDQLAGALDWRQPEVVMYERKVTTPRLVANLDGHEIEALDSMASALTSRYGVSLGRVTVNWYRTGSDSVAWHGDRVARDLARAVVAVVSLRGPRDFRFRPAGGGESMSLSVGFGDLVVMGGTFQRTWRHAIPKVRSAPPRMAVMFRHDYDPETLAKAPV